MDDQCIGDRHVKYYPCNYLIFNDLVWEVRGSAKKDHIRIDIASSLPGHNNTFKRSINSWLSEIIDHTLDCHSLVWRWKYDCGRGAQQVPYILGIYIIHSLHIPPAPSFTACLENPQYGKYLTHHYQVQIHLKGGSIKKLCWLPILSCVL